jgi:hypothetical protein
MFRHFAIRDVSIFVATIALWWASLAVDPESSLASALSIPAGVGAAICAFNLHEWGHLLGAHLTDSVYVPAKRLVSPFLFAYDAEHNTRRQFLIMSLAGFAATAAFVAGFLLWMPQDQAAGRIGRNLSEAVFNVTRKRTPCSISRLPDDHRKRQWN